MILRSFASFVEEGIAKKQRPDLSKANSLIGEAQMRLTFLDDVVKKIKIHDSNANYVVETAYDIILEHIRARLSIDGYKTSGNSAHEAEVSYFLVVGFSQKDVLFINELRYWRNGILYYGKRVDAAYANAVVKFLEKILPKLKSIVKK